jgi:hypothetical protein
VKQQTVLVAKSMPLTGIPSRGITETMVVSSRLLIVFTSIAMLAGCVFLPVAVPKPQTIIDPNAPVEQQVQFWLVRLDETDAFHGEWVPAVMELIKIGEPALEPTLPFLLSDKAFTREHAVKVIYFILHSIHEKEGFTELSNSLWDSKGDWRKEVESAPLEERIEFIQRVNRWLVVRRGTSG